MEPYLNSFEHLADELARLDLLLRRAVLVAREEHLHSASDVYRGLLITEEEVDDLMKSEQLLLERGQRMAKLEAPLKELDGKAALLRRHIDDRRSLAAGSAAHLTLPHLARCFGLSSAEVDLLLIALAPELKPKYEMLYAYLQNDVTRKRPSVDLAFDLICRSEFEKAQARRFLSPQAPLVRYRLLQLGEETYDRKPPLLRRFLKLDDAVVNYLLGSKCQREPTRSGDEGLAQAFDAALRAQMENLARHLKHSKRPTNVVQLVGATLEAARSGADVLASAAGFPLVLCARGATGDSEQEAEEWMASQVRDAMLSGAVLAIESPTFDSPGGESPRTRGYESVFWEQVRNFRGTVILLARNGARLEVPSDIHFIRAQLPANSFLSRRRTWEQSLNGCGGSLDAGRLADGFELSAAQIRQTIELAAATAALRNPEKPEPNMQDMIEAARHLTTCHLQRFATRVEPRFTWRDIILPADRLEQLKSISGRMRYRHRVQQEWGLGQRLSRGRGLSVLFTGPSGVGKTTAAEALASDLALDLYEIDLSSVVSKYIGETEKNLSEIFHEAEATQAVLFFDEADALFGRRTEIKDAHDRYANIEVNYLLQRVDQFAGLVVMATNMQRNLDDAFLRRIHEIVEFPFPDETLRERIWRCHLAAGAPRDEDIDFSFLARQFKLTGGSIKNIVVSAAYRAAQDARPIRMMDLVLSTKAEHQKLGKMCLKADFGSFYELIGQGM